MGLPSRPPLISSGMFARGAPELTSCPRTTLPCAVAGVAARPAASTFVEVEPCGAPYAVGCDGCDRLAVVPAKREATATLRRRARDITRQKIHSLGRWATRPAIQNAISVYDVDACP